MAIKNVDVLSLFGHGDATEPDGESGTRMGPGKKKASKEDVTTDDIPNNLNHLRLVFLAGCWTGGMVGWGEDAVRQPEPSSIAGKFLQGNVQSVIFTGDEVSFGALDLFADRFWTLVTKTHLWTFPTGYYSRLSLPGHYSISVRSAAIRAKSESLLFAESNLRKKYVMTIFVWGDSQLAH